MLKRKRTYKLTVPLAKRSRLKLAYYAIEHDTSMAGGVRTWIDSLPDPPPEWVPPPTEDEEEKADDL